MWGSRGLRCCSSHRICSIVILPDPVCSPTCPRTTDGLEVSITTAVVRRYRDLRIREERVTKDLEDFRADVPELSRLPREVHRILSCIHEHLFDPALNVSALRSWCALRNTNVSTTFRRAMGLGIREYIEFQRLDAAAFLLSRHKDEVFLIASVVGYENHETFCRAFQRFFRCTPSEFRAQRRPQEKTSRPFDTFSLTIQLHKESAEAPIYGALE